MLRHHDARRAPQAYCHNTMFVLSQLPLLRAEISVLVNGFYGCRVQLRSTRFVLSGPRPSFFCHVTAAWPGDISRQTVPLGEALALLSCIFVIINVKQGIPRVSTTYSYPFPAVKRHLSRA